MLIEVTYDGRRLMVAPDPARVLLGEDVNWVVSTPPDLSYSRTSFARLRWEIYLDHGSPFAGSATSLQLTTTAAALTGVAHRGMLRGGPARLAGDYKYGVRLFSASGQDPVEDEDLYLLVTW